MTVCGACGSDHPRGRRHCPSCGIGPDQAGEMQDWPPLLRSGPDRSESGDALTAVAVDGGNLSTTRSAELVADAVAERAPGMAGRRLAGVALVVVGLVLVASGAYTAYRDRYEPRGGTPPGAPHTSGGRSPVPTPHPTAAPRPSGSGVTPATTSPVATADPDQVVTVAPALSGQRDVAAVTETLTTYFTAINERDYDAYRSVLVVAGDRVGDEADFLRRFRSTRDSDVRLVGIRRDPDGEVFATVTFRSTQDPADAPPGLSAACVSWVLTYPMTRDGDGVLKIDVVRQFAQTYSAC